MIDPNMVDHYKKIYPAGTRIRLLHMEDRTAPIEYGTLGTVVFVDDMGQIHMNWDNGRTLVLVPGEDIFQVVELPIGGVSNE